MLYPSSSFYYFLLYTLVVVPLPPLVSAALPLATNSNTKRRGDHLHEILLSQHSKSSPSSSSSILEWQLHNNRDFEGQQSRPLGEEKRRRIHSEEVYPEKSSLQPTKFPKYTLQQRKIRTPTGRRRPHVRHYMVQKGGKNKSYMHGIQLMTQWEKPLITAKNNAKCPRKVDAIVEGFKPRSHYSDSSMERSYKRLFMFSGEMVYEVWRDEQGLQQRQAFLIWDLFPRGPRQVTAAVHNQRSNITVLFAWRHVYRYRWNTQHNRFHILRNSPKPLTNMVDFVPRVAFQWTSGHLVLANNKRFALYEPYRNSATLVSSKVSDHFPNLEMESLAGVAARDRNFMLWMTKEGRVQIYDLKTQKTGLELPLNLPRFLACLNDFNSTTIGDNATDG